jgi:hypothetical protein
LAEGGYQVGTLAKLCYSSGIESLSDKTEVSC